MGDGQTQKPERRTYDNRLRAEQASATRERILEAVNRLFASSSFDEFSVGRVAKEAGVSEPTIYRHFGSREGLIDAFDPWFAERLGHPGYPESVAEVAPAVPGLFSFFAANETLVRTAASDARSEVIKRGRSQRRQRIRELFEPAVEHLPSEKAAACRAVLSEVLSSRNWLALKDEHGLTNEQAAMGAQWAIEALVAALKPESSQ